MAHLDDSSHHFAWEAQELKEAFSDDPMEEEALPPGAMGPSGSDHEALLPRMNVDASLREIVSNDLKNLYLLWEQQLALGNKLVLDLPTYHAFLANIRWKSGAESRGEAPLSLFLRP